MRLARWLSGRLAPGADPATDLSARTRLGLLEGWSSIVLNTALAGLKIFLAMVTGSLAVGADAVHTLTDGLTSLVTVFGFTLARKPADEQHPYGHARIEGLSAVVISVLLAVAAFELLKQAVGRLLSPRPVHMHLWVIGALVGTMVLKEFQARLSRDLGHLTESETLHAEAWHHRSDVLSTALVVIAAAGARWGALWLDGAAGILVAGLIGWAAVQVMRKAAGPLLGQRPPAHMVEEIVRIARSLPAVRGVHDIMVHKYGTLNIVSLHIEVPDRYSPIALHEMGAEIEERIARRFPGHAVVHVDPLNLDHPYYAEVGRIVAEALEKHRGATSFHDLRLIGGPDRFKVIFDVTVGPTTGEEDIAALRQEVERRLAARFPHARVAINVEPPYVNHEPVGGTGPDRA